MPKSGRRQGYPLKLSYAGDMILYIENRKEFIQILLQQTGEFSSLSGYNINV